MQSTFLHQFHCRTRRGKVLKIVREHYLRDDISCQSDLCEICAHSSNSSKLSAKPFRKRYLLIDTNVVLHQIDLLESPAFTNVIVLQTVADEVKHRDLSIFHRLQNLIRDESRHFVLFANQHHRATHCTRVYKESINDFQDRHIRKSLAWYQDHLRHLSISVLFVCDDAKSLSIAKEEGYDGCTTCELVQSLSSEYPELSDLLAFHSSDIDHRQSHLQPIFLEHRPLSEITAGLKSGKLFKGILHTSRANCNEGWIRTKSSSIEIDIFIPDQFHLNRAFDGDLVAVTLLPREKWRPPSEKIVTNEGNVAPLTASEAAVDAEIGVDAESDSESPDQSDENSKDMKDEALSFTDGFKPTGQVVGIIRRNWRSYCGSIDPEAVTSDNMAIFVPVDQRIPHIEIATRQKEHFIGKRIVVRVDEWRISSKYPSGHFIRSLGKAGEKEVETEVLLFEHEIPSRPFSEKQLACLPPSDWCIVPENSMGRVDLRSILVCSIDPPNCKDIDDALHVQELENGLYEVGVHIADVSYFVPAGCALDVEASRRGTSTYLVEKRLDMLPGLLSERLCSLRANEDKFAFSVTWTMSKDARILETKFFKSIIRSQSALSYPEAQTMIDDIKDQRPIANSVRLLNKLAKILRMRRMEAGALTLASPAVKFELDSETQDPLDIEMYQLKEANALVEEFMLLANISVAQHITKHFPSHSCLRRHPVPNKKNFELLINAAGALGFNIHVDSSKDLSDSLDNAVIPDHPYFNNLIRILATRCMTQARYYCSGDFPPSEYYHYGLATPIYTHFTSPIRRYADIIVHRLLAASLGIAPLPLSLTSKQNVKSITDNLNRRHHMAQLAGRASVQLHTLIYFRNKCLVEDAYVMAIKINGIHIIVPRFGIEGFIILSDEDDKKSKGQILHFDSEKFQMTYKSDAGDEMSIRVFEKVNVRISVEEKGLYQESLKLELLTKSLKRKIQEQSNSNRAKSEKGSKIAKSTKRIKSKK